MREMQERCMKCMKENGGLQECPHCGFNKNHQQLSPYLALGSLVNNRYLVGLVKESNTEGATYTAWDQVASRQVNVREFLPNAIVSREEGNNALMVMRGGEMTYSECHSAFVELWRKLAAFRNLPAMPNVLDIFEENGTSYVVTEYEKSLTLRELLLKSNSGSLTWERARQLFMPVMATLDQLHSSGIIHRGISPTTLVLHRDGKINLSGFSIAHVRSAGSDLSPELFDGYSAIEQYDAQGRHSPRTDIYAFAAVMYRTLVGSDPIDAPTRMQNDRLMIPGKIAEQIPAYVINALINALQISPADRTASIKSFRDELSASPTAALAATQTSVQEPRPKAQIAPKISLWSNMSKFEKRRILLVTGVTVAVGLLVVLLIWGIAGREGKKPDSTDGQSTSSHISEMIEVPDFAALGTILTIQANPIWRESFDIDVIEVYDSNVGKGMIIAQDKAVGSEVEKGSKVTLTVSLGAEMIELPGNIIGMDYEEAKALLSDLGFSVEKREEPNDGSKTDNQVSAVNLAAGKEYSKGTAVTLRVWAPYDDSKTTTATPAVPATTTTRRPTQTQAPTTAPTTASPTTTTDPATQPTEPTSPSQESTVPTEPQPTQAEEENGD